jgi:nucleoid-associated protein YgaU
MSKDVKTGMLIGLVFVIVGVVVISTWPGGSVEKRLLSAKADDNIQPVTPTLKGPPVAAQDKTVVAPPPVAPSPTDNVTVEPPVKETEAIEKVAEYVVDESQKTDVDASPRIHIVQPNENLSTIAKLHYGDPNKWSLIANANKNVIKNVNFVSPGTRLVIPKP